MNKSPKEIIAFAESWLKDNADSLPLEIRLLLYKAIEDEKKEGANNE
jgi:hypothetical protein